MAMTGSQERHRSQHPGSRGPIVFYFDFISPFAYVGSVAIERLGARLGRAVEWRPVLIGVTILKIMGMRPLREIPLKGPYLARDLERLAQWFEVAVRPHGLGTVNPVMASRAYLWLVDNAPDRAKPFAQEVFARLWTRGIDIGGIEAVVDCARQVGADGAAVRAHLDDDGAREGLRRSVEQAVSLGVFGVPSFIADGELFWGNDHLWMLEHWLRTGSFAPGSG